MDAHKHTLEESKMKLKQLIKSNDESISLQNDRILSQKRILDAAKMRLEESKPELEQLKKYRDILSLSLSMDQLHSLVPESRKLLILSEIDKTIVELECEFASITHENARIEREIASIECELMVIKCANSFYDVSFLEII